MSAWLVSHAHISALVSARHWATGFPGPSGLPAVSDTILGRLLLRENYLSLAARYGDPVDNVEIDAFRYADPRPHSPLEILKAIDCYEYQACEHDGWQASVARRYCEWLRCLAVSRLPGYEALPWGLD